MTLVEYSRRRLHLKYYLQAILNSTSASSASTTGRSLSEFMNYMKSTFQKNINDNGDKSKLKGYFLVLVRDSSQDARDSPLV